MSDWEEPWHADRLYRTNRLFSRYSNEYLRWQQIKPYIDGFPKAVCPIFGKDILCFDNIKNSGKLDEKNEDNLKNTLGEFVKTFN